MEDKINFRHLIHNESNCKGETFWAPTFAVMDNKIQIKLRDLEKKSEIPSS
jgi:hypothetical protein